MHPWLTHLQCEAISQGAQIMMGVFTVPLCIVSKNKTQSNSVQEVVTLLSHTCIASRIINIPHQNDTFVTADKPTSAHHNHLKSTVYIGFTHCVVHSMVWDKCIITSTHHYGIIQSVFMALKILCVLPSHPSSPPTNPCQTLFSTFVQWVIVFSCHVCG